MLPRVMTTAWPVASGSSMNVCPGNSLPMSKQGCMSPSLEVVMRPPEVFGRELSLEEGARLKSISRRAKYQSKRQRVMILLASSTGMPAPQIAAAVRSDESHVRKVIHAFNEQCSVRWTLATGAGAQGRRRRAARRDRLGRARPPRHAGRPAHALVACQAP